MLFRSAAARVLLGLCCLAPLLLPAEAHAENQDTLQFDTGFLSASNRCRGVRILAEHDATLVSFDYYTQNSSGTELHWVVYESTTSTGTYNRMDQATEVTDGTYNATTAGWQIGPEVGVDLVAGRYYAIMTCWDESQAVFYQYAGSPPASEISVGQFIGGARHNSFSTLGASATLSNSFAYSVRLHTSADETVDAYPAGSSLTMPAATASPRARGMIYGVDEPTVLSGFKQLYNRTSGCISIFTTCPTSTWYVMSCDESSAAACDDTNDWDLVETGTLGGAGLLLGEFWYGPDDLQIELDPSLMYFLGISDSNDDIEYTYVSGGVVNAEDPSWGDTAAGAFASLHPLPSPATIGDSSTLYPQQVYTVGREGDEYQAPSTNTLQTGNFYGQVFEASENTLIEQFAVKFDPCDEEDVEYAVYQGSSVTGPWTKLMSRTLEVTSTAENWLESGPLDISVTAQTGARHYMFALRAPSCDTTMDFDTFQANQPVAWGTRTYGVYYPSATFPSTIASTSAFDNSAWSMSWRVEACSTCGDYDADGYTTDVDCDDDVFSVNPGATEVCNGTDDDCDGTTDEGFDQDGDGWTTCAGDCDDGNPAAFPGGTEVCDGVNNDCDTATDEGFDDDGDGFFDGSDSGCTATYSPTDCNDANADIFPGQEELCDMVDNDCDGALDEDFDRDGDEYVDLFGDGCETSWPSNLLDCEDSNSSINPGAGEACNATDDDCDGFTDEDFDFDGDGYFDESAPGCSAAHSNPDCNDNNAAIHPFAAEVCNEVDDDCNGALPDDEDDDDGDGLVDCEGDCDDTNPSIGEGFAEVCDGYDNDCDNILGALGEFDDDGDGFLVCAFVVGGNPAFEGGSDCADNDPDTYPGAPEVCDGIDNNCNGTAADEGLDVDGDGVNTCTDCDDGDANVFPGAPEICDGKDSDCDGNTPTDELDQDFDTQSACEGDCDDNNEFRASFLDEDCDGWDNDCNGATNAAGGEGDSDNDQYLGCSDFVSNGATNSAGETLLAGGDCDTSDADQYPGAPELCNAEDDDCDNGVDEGFDSDGDGYFTDDDPGCVASYPSADCDDGNAAISPADVEVCNQIDDDCDNSTDEGFDNDGDGHFDATDCVFGDDCNDADASVSPSAPEACNGVDDDCDGTTDEGFDGDGDGYLDEVACGAFGDDCDDADATEFPGAFEDCDGEDEDCDGTVDEGYDADGDGHNSIAICGAFGDDCNDTDSAVSPSALETCNRIDDDCDGTIPPDEIDDDLDTMTECEGDCDDADATVSLGAPEACDSLDNDCDGTVDEGFDLDGDGYDSQEECAAGDDCDDLDPAINPTGIEVCDGADNDCDGDTDEGFDSDGDGYPTATDADCLLAYGDNADCDDTNASINPFAPEFCDAADQDCDGDVDEDFDLDGDTYFSGGEPDCVSAYADVDCDDNNPDAYPGNPEVCDTIDNDCEGGIDEDFDLDLDGWFTTAEPACSNAYPLGTDCADDDAARFPGNPEVCDGLDNDCSGSVPDDETDGDGDTFTECADGDCDDADIAQYVGAPETCNSEDDDCDGMVDEDFDADSDSYFDDADPLCVSTYGASADCDDAVAAVNPAATELCNAIDDDCDGTVDLEFDADEDGAWDVGPCAAAYPPSVLDCDDGNAAVNPFAAEECTNGIDDNCDGVTDQDSDNDGDGVSTCSGDCDDDDPAIFPTAPEVCNQADDNCDGVVDDGFDTDGDGFLVDTTECQAAYPTSEFDCDDTNFDINPASSELCNGSDDDCDGDLDEDFDLDGDGFYDEQAPGCDSVWADLDCDDLAAGVNPLESEICNLVDENCDGTVDEGFDADNDGYNDASDAGCAANYPDADCDDADASVNPGATEACNGLDDDCDTVVPLLESDNDGDGYVECDPPVNHVGTPVGGGDCDDGDAAISPGAPEICNELDEDCDGEIDEDFDADLDGFPDELEPSCQANIGGGLDCDDTDDAIFPDQIELCDEVDQDCDGDIDEDFDADGDGFLTDDVSAGCLADDLDCDDADAAINPFVLEDCSNGVDDNCNGAVDEDVDEDGDGATTCADDCNDDDANVYVGAPEICDGLDQSCDGVVDEGFDNDGDGFLTDDPAFGCDTIVPAVPLDCEDGDTDINPDADEVCDGVDNDCDGLVDELFDADADGYFDRFNPDCSATYGVLNTDCDDTDAVVNPGASELCNALDDDCDGIPDDGIDGDGDGVWPDTAECQTAYGDLGDLDCDDADDTIFPAFDGNDAADELCDLLDNDCDGAIPEDVDQDGFPDAANADCVNEYPAEDLDCDDANGDVSPDADEVCDDTVDNDCDGDVDMDDTDCQAGDDDDSAGDDDDATGDDDDATGDDDDATGDDDDATGDDDDSADPPINYTPGGDGDAPSVAGGCSECRSDVAGSDSSWLMGLGLLGLLGLRRRRQGSGLWLAVVLMLATPVLLPAPAAAQGALEQEASRQLNFAWEELKNESWDKAISSADSALRLNPALYTAMVVKALAYEGKGELRRAESWLQTYLDLTSNLSQAPEAVDLADRLKQSLAGGGGGTGGTTVKAEATVKTGKDYGAFGDGSVVVGGLIGGRGYAQTPCAGTAGCEAGAEQRPGFWAYDGGGATGGLSVQAEYFPGGWFVGPKVRYDLAAPEPVAHHEVERGEEPGHRLDAGAVVRIPLLRGLTKLHVLADVGYGLRSWMVYENTSRTSATSYQLPAHQLGGGVGVRIEPGRVVGIDVRGGFAGTLGGLGGISEVTASAAVGIRPIEWIQIRAGFDLRRSSVLLERGTAVVEVTDLSVGAVVGAGVVF